MVGSGVNRNVKRQQKQRPIIGIFPGSMTTFGKALGENKIVKTMKRGLFGLYAVYENKFVEYEESDFIDNKVFNGGGGSGVLVATPSPDPPKKNPGDAIAVEETPVEAIPVDKPLETKDYF